MGNFKCFQLLLEMFSMLSVTTTQTANPMPGKTSNPLLHTAIITCTNVRPVLYYFDPSAKFCTFLVLDPLAVDILKKNAHALFLDVSPQCIFFKIP